MKHCLAVTNTLPNRPYYFMVICKYKFDKTQVQWLTKQNQKTYSLRKKVSQIKHWLIMMFTTIVHLSCQMAVSTSCTYTKHQDKDKTHYWHTQVYTKWNKISRLGPKLTIKERTVLTGSHWTTKRLTTGLVLERTHHHHTHHAKLLFHKLHEFKHFYTKTNKHLEGKLGVSPQLSFNFSSTILHYSTHAHTHTKIKTPVTTFSQSE